MKRSPLVESTIQEMLGLLPDFFDRKDDVLLQNLASLARAEENFPTIALRNSALLASWEPMHAESFPSGEGLAALLCLLYLTPRLQRELFPVYEHPPKGCDELRKRGFIFRKKNKDGEDVGRNFTIFTAEGEMREITGFDLGRASKKSAWSLPKKYSKRIQTIFGKDILGIGERLEVDHRMPEAARIQFNVAPASLSEETLRTGECWEQFQMLSPQLNTMKREACGKCLNGGDIIVPPLAAATKAYRETRGKGAAGCIGCFWYDPFRPHIQKFLPGLAVSKEEYQKKIEKVSALITKKESN